MKVLLVGGAGYLGQRILDHIGPDNVTVYDRLLYADEFTRQCNFVLGDVGDKIKLNLALQNVDCVVWLAAIVGDAACENQPITAVETNTNALCWLRHNYDGKIIFTSTCSTYGINDGVATEETKLKPLSLYAETKVKAEEIIKDRAIILRLGTLYGTSHRMRFDLVVNAMSKDAVTKGVVNVFGGAQSRPLLSVKDAAMFIVSLLRRDVPNGIYNVASHNMTIADVGGIVSRSLDAELETTQTETQDSRSYRVSCEKAISHLGFAPSRMITTEARNIAHLIKTGRIKNVDLDKYYNSRGSYEAKNNRWRFVS